MPFGWSFQLLHVVSDGREVVRITILPDVSVESAEGVSLLFAVGGDEVFAIEHFRLPVRQTVGWFAEKVGREDLLVVETP